MSVNDCTLYMFITLQKYTNYNTKKIPKEAFSGGKE